MIDCWDVTLFAEFFFPCTTRQRNWTWDPLQLMQDLKDEQLLLSCTCTLCPIYFYAEGSNASCPNRNFLSSKEDNIVLISLGIYFDWGSWSLKLCLINYLFMTFAFYLMFFIFFYCYYNQYYSLELCICVTPPLYRTERNLPWNTLTLFCIVYFFESIQSMFFYFFFLKVCVNF